MLVPLGITFGLFTVLAGHLPADTSSLQLKAIQTYSDGTVVSWIEPVLARASVTPMSTFCSCAAA